MRLFRRYLLQGLWAMYKVICVRFRHKPPFVWLLHEIFIALFFRKPYSVFLGFEVQMRPLQEIGTGLPAHKWVFPAVTLLKDVPIHSPLVAVP